MQIEHVEIGGQFYCLETRVCAGGCGKEFKCLPSSPARHARFYCEHVCGKRALTAAERKRMFGIRLGPEKDPAPTGLPPGERSHGRPVSVAETPQPEPPAPEPVEEDTHEEESAPAEEAPEERASEERAPTERAGAVSALPSEEGGGGAPELEIVDGEERMRTWLAAVEEAKQCIANLNQYRHRIIQLALSCCDIVHGGGGHWSGHSELYTLRRFAKEVGMQYRTLWNWISIYRNVISVLEPGEYSEADFRFAHATLKRVGHRSTPQQARDEFRRHKAGSKNFYKLGSIVQWAKTHRRFVLNENLDELDRGDLEALLMLTEDTAARLREYLGKCKTPETLASGVNGSQTSNSL